MRALHNFAVSGTPVCRELLLALVTVKKAAAITNERVGRLSPKIAGAIGKACDEILAGGLADQFPVDCLQGGAGTSTNMNVNEVLANRAAELLGGKKGDYSLVHPIDHVNLSQSTNDVFPTAVRIAAIRLLRPLSEEFARLQSALQEKESEFSEIVKVGRTELQDAVPVTLGQEFGAWAQAFARDRWRLYKAEERLRQVNIGGTAVGTGVNAPKKYIFEMIETLRSLTGIGLARAEYMMDPTQNCDVFVEVSGLLKTSAVSLAKVSGDLRLLSSGPRAGIGEILLPPLQPGSSIMPGKVNPVLPEMVTQAAYQVIADDTAVTLAAQAGQLELNAFLPLLAKNLLEMLALLQRAVAAFTDLCVSGIRADEARCKALLDRSLTTAAGLISTIGYDRASLVMKRAEQAGSSLRGELLREGILNESEIDAALDAAAMTRPGIPGAPKNGGKADS